MDMDMDTVWTSLKIRNGIDCDTFFVAGLIVGWSRVTTHSMEIADATVCYSTVLYILYNKIY